MGVCSSSELRASETLQPDANQDEPSWSSDSPVSSDSAGKGGRLVQEGGGRGGSGPDQGEERRRHSQQRPENKGRPEARGQGAERWVLVQESRRWQWRCSFGSGEE